MDTKDYIGSGILEDFVLGMVSEQEKKEVQCLSKIYPEIASYIAEIEDEMAGAVLADAVEPPKSLKAKILDNLPDRDAEDEAPVMPVREEPKLEVVRDEKTSSEPTEKRSVFPYSIAASLVIIVGLGAMYITTLTKSNSQGEQIIDLQTQVGLVEQQLESMQSQVAALSNDLDIVTAPSTKRIELNSVGDFEAQVLVYWNPESQDVLLESINMPAVPEGSQYQLWTLVDGNPVDQGMLPLDDAEGLAKMKSANLADAFAITLEPAGGSESPTLEQLIVLGAVEG